MAKGGMAKVVSERQRFRQILVETERAADGAGDLCHLDGVGQARAVVVAGMSDEDLGLVLEPTEGRRMDDPVTVPLKGIARRTLRLSMQPPPALLRPTGDRVARGRGDAHGPDPTRAALANQ